MPKTILTIFAISKIPTNQEFQENSIKDIKKAIIKSGYQPISIKAYSDIMFDFRYCPSCNNIISKRKLERLSLNTVCPNCGLTKVGQYYSYGSQIHLKVISGKLTQDEESHSWHMPPSFPEELLPR